MPLTLRRLLIPILALLCVTVLALSQLVRTEPGFSRADLATGVVAVGLSVLALLVAAWVRGTTRGTAATIPWASLFFLMSWMVGTLVQLVVGPEQWIMAPIAALAVGIPVLLGASWLWLFPLLPAFRLKRLKSDPAALDAAVADLLRGLRRRTPRAGLPARRHAQVAIVAAASLAELRRWQDAAGALEAVALDAIDPYRRSLVQASRAVALLYQGQRRAAWDAMNDANRHASGNPALAQSLAINAELFASLEGPPEPVLKRLEEMGRPKAPHLQRGWLLAQANALAAAGDSEGSRRALGELKLVAPDGLERAVDLKGPAWQLADELRRMQPDIAPS